MGYVRYDSPEAVAALNALYQQELRLFQNLFLPSVKLVRKIRVGARIRRVYDRPQTPFERVQACPEADPLRVAHLQHLRATLDPFALAEAIDAAARAPGRPRPSPRGLVVARSPHTDDATRRRTSAPRDAAVQRCPTACGISLRGGSRGVRLSGRAG